MIKGVLKIFFNISKEEWNEMDRKLLRIGIGLISFIIAALFWFYVFRAFSPFKF